jgi:predicted HAD superfamily phosphohydrolase
MDKKRNGQDRSLYRYEDILRAVGRFIDEQGIQDVVVLQVNAEVRVQGYRSVSRTGGLSPKLVEHTFTADDLRQIDEDSQKRRGRGSRLFG